ncbi:MAG: DUF4126 domain-containing protein [Usitatibacter sp.]
MSAGDAALFATQLAMGFALAASVGLRTFLPLLVAGILARNGYVQMGPSFAWMETTPALVVFGSAVVFEILADKVPGLDHALHAVEAFVKPVAATLLAASLFTDLDPVLAVTLGLIGGGTIAGAVHAMRGAARLVSTGATAGLANPVLSLVDDALAVIGIAVAILAPIIAALAVVALAILAARILRRRARRVSGATPSANP